MTAKLPESRPASVTIFMQDGSRFQASVETNRGDWRDPYSPDQLFVKYVSLARRLWPESLCRQIADRIQNIEQETEINTIFKDTLSPSMAAATPASQQNEESR